MALVPYLRWLGICAVVVVVAGALPARPAAGRPSGGALPGRRGGPDAPAALDPGEDGVLMPARALLVAFRPSVFSLTMGAFPIFAATALLFTLAGLWLTHDAGRGEGLLHRAARRWVLVGLLLPWPALAVWSPFLAYVAFGTGVRSCNPTSGRGSLPLAAVELSGKCMIARPDPDPPLMIIPLNRTADNTWSVPASIRLNDTQYEAFRLGNLYVNVHSAANPGGEIRGQVTP